MTHRTRTSTSIRCAFVLAGMAIIATLGGCSADDPFNPSFALTYHDSRLALRDMVGDPRAFERPVIVLGGIYDPGVAASVVADRFRRLGGEDDVVASIAFFGLGDFSRCRDRVIARVDKLVPTDDPEWTAEVDVIGISMGGLVARYAAAPNEGGRRLRVRRLFTISTPHQGATMASFPTIDRRALDMRAGSSFLRELDASLAAADYQIISYTRLDDAIVGEENAAPDGHAPFWVSNVPGSFAHLFAMDDPRILADIARHLRGETPYTTWPPAPLPGRASPHDAPTH